MKEVIYAIFISYYAVVFWRFFGWISAVAPLLTLHRKFLLFDIQHLVGSDLLVLLLI
jgi:hypothetical protein